MVITVKLLKNSDHTFEKGDILNIKGEKIGSHEGIVNYTIGQRRGIKIAIKNLYMLLKSIVKKIQLL